MTPNNGHSTPSLGAQAMAALDAHKAGQDSAAGPSMPVPASALDARAETRTRIADVAASEARSLIPARESAEQMMRRERYERLVLGREPRAPDVHRAGSTAVARASEERAVFGEPALSEGEETALRLAARVRAQSRHAGQVARHSLSTYGLRALSVAGKLPSR